MIINVNQIFVKLFPFILGFSYTNAQTQKVIINLISNALCQHAPIKKNDSQFQAKNVQKTEWFVSECKKNRKVNKNLFQLIEIKLPKIIGKTIVFAIKNWLV